MVNLTISSRATQANLLLRWKLGHVDTKNRDDRNILLQQCPCLLTMFHIAIDQLSPKEFGKFLAVMRKCVLQLYYWVTTPCSDSQLFNDCARLRDHFYLRCHAEIILDMGNGSMQEIALCIKKLKELEPIRFPGRKNPDDDWHFYYRFFDALLDELQKGFNARYSFGEFVSLSREYRREMLLKVELLPRSAPTVQILPEVDVGVASGLADNRIPPSKFCKATKTFPGGETCPVCTEDIQDKTDSESVVVTKCGHHYHSQCLDSWVNDSGSVNSNTCPSCRAVLYT